MAVLRNAFLLLALSLGLTAQAHAWCFAEAGQRYHIDPLLLKAIAIKETNLNPKAIGKNRDKKGNVTSRDYGLMQIAAGSLVMPVLTGRSVYRGRHSSPELKPDSVSRR